MTKIIASIEAGACTQTGADLGPSAGEDAMFGAGTGTGTPSSSSDGPTARRESEAVLTEMIATIEAGARTHTGANLGPCVGKDAVVGAGTGAVADTGAGTGSGAESGEGAAAGAGVKLAEGTGLEEGVAVRQTRYLFDSVCSADALFI